MIRRIVALALLIAIVVGVVAIAKSLFGDSSTDAATTSSTGVDGSSPASSGDVPDGSTATTEAAVTTTSTPTVPSASTPARVLLVGDSQAQGLAPFLETALKAGGLTTLQSDGRNSTGLVRNDFFDWPAQLATLVPSVNPDIVVAFFGGNDGQGFSTPPIPKVDSDAWREEFGRRVDEVLALVSAPNRTVIWIGVPTHPKESTNAALAVQTEVVRERLAAHPEVHYVDLWSLYAGINGGFARLARDPFNGTYLDLRSKADGFHLNTPGTKILASLVTNVIADALVAKGADSASSMITPTIPADQPGTYTIEANDTLSLIANRVGTTVAAIVAVNGWADETQLIYVGLDIKLPAPPAQQPATAVASNDAGTPSTDAPPASTG